MTEVAKAYGDALYELSLENKNSKDILDEILVLKQIFEENPKFIKLLDAPTINKDEKLKIVDESFKDKVDTTVLNFIKILVENTYAGFFTECVKEFRTRYNADNNIIDVTAITAISMSDELMNKLKAKLESVTGKTVMLVNKVDESVIAGVDLQMEGVQLENSVKSKIDSIRKTLLNLTAY